MAIIHQTGNCIKLAIVSSIYLCINIYLYIHFCVYIQQYSVLNFGRLLRAATQIPGQIFRWAYWKKLPKRMGSFEKSPNSQPRNQMPWTKRHSFNFQLLHSSWPKQFPPTKKLYIKNTQNPRSIIPGPKKNKQKQGRFNPWLQGDTTSGGSSSASVGGATSGGATSLSSTKSTGFRAFSKGRRNQTGFVTSVPNT